ncbi:MAG: M23 family metallopeptidase [Bacteroidales bacterium]
MSKKIYYRYNNQTLTYERVYPSAGERAWGVIRYLITSILMGGGLFFLLAYYIDSPFEAMLKREISVLTSQNRILSKRIDEAQSVMTELQMRDDNLYRVMLQAEPIPPELRAAQYGRTNRYQEFDALSNASLIKNTAEKMDLLNKQLFIQSHSYDELLDLFNTREVRLMAIPAIQPVLNKDLKQTSSGFGRRIDPVYKTVRMHTGMDFTAKIGTPVYATGDGTVEQADWDQGYGKTIVINHGFGYKTKYAHLHDYSVKRGTVVKRGQVIGKVGNTGKSTGPHLHYEVLYRGKHVNPQNYYFMDLSPQEYDKMVLLSSTQGMMMD